jgi:hypothetical protein
MVSGFSAGERKAWGRMQWVTNLQITRDVDRCNAGFYGGADTGLAVAVGLLVSRNEISVSMQNPSLIFCSISA